MKDIIAHDTKCKCDVIKLAFALYDRKVFSLEDIKNMLGVEFETGGMGENSVLYDTPPVCRIDAFLGFFDRQLISREVLLKRSKEILTEMKKENKKGR